MAKERLSLGTNCTFSYLFLPEGENTCIEEFVFTSSFLLYDIEKGQKEISPDFSPKNIWNRDRGYLVS